MRFLLSILSLFIFCNFFGQSFDEEYSYTFLGSDDFIEFRKLTEDSPNSRDYKRSKGQRIVTMNNQDTVIINYYWNNHAVDNGEGEALWVLDSIITDYYCCVCAESAVEYYSSNQSIYEKNYIQTGENEWLDSKYISWGKTNNRERKRNTKFYGLKKLSIHKNNNANLCLTFKRAKTVLTEEEYKLLKKKN